jgi:hypothetical protein
MATLILKLAIRIIWKAWKVFLECLKLLGIFKTCSRLMRTKAGWLLLHQNHLFKTLARNHGPNRKVRLWQKMNLKWSVVWQMLQLLMLLEQ